MSYFDCKPQAVKQAIANYIPLAPSQECAPASPKKCGVPKKRNSAMYHDDEDFDDGFSPALPVSIGYSEVSKQRSFLLSQLSDVEDRQETTLRKQYGLMDDDEPRSFNDLMDRIKAGKYVIKDEDKNKPAWGYGLNLVKWRDPAVKEDQTGFEAAQKIMRVSYTDAIRTIKISDPKEGLAALKSFESASFQ